MSLDYKNIGTLFSLNLLNVILNVAYSTLMVYFFGTTSKVEAFFAATLLGTTISRFVQTGQLVEILVPRYHKTKAEVSPQAARSIISMMCNYMVGAAFILVIIFVASGNLVTDLLVPGFSSNVKAQVYQIFCITGFLMPVQIATNLFQGMLNAENIYGKVELTNTFSLLISLLVLIIWGPSESVNILVIGLILSVLLQFLTTVYYLRQVGYRHQFIWRNPYFSLKELWKAISATFLYMGGVQFQTFIFNAALSFLPTGMFAIYRYVETIYGKVANIFIIPVSTVFLNDVNRFLTQDNSQQIKAFVGKNLDFSYLISFLILIPFLVAGQYFIWTLWGGSKFTVDNVHQVYLLLIVFFLTMLWNGPYMIYRKLAVSVSRPDLQYYLWAVAQVISGLTSYFLIKTWQFHGLQIQVFFHTCIIAVIPMATVFYYKRQYFAFYNWLEVIKITIAVSACVIIHYFTFQYFPIFSSISKIQSLFIGGFLAVFSLILFLIFCYFLKVREIEILNLKIQTTLGKLPFLRKLLSTK